jgi:hypothetical protein
MPPLFITPVRNVKLRAIVDPAQYDFEVNAARKLKFTSASKHKPKSIMVNHTIRNDNGVIYDPDQYDEEENKMRHVNKTKSIDELRDVFDW